MHGGTAWPLGSQTGCCLQTGRRLFNMECSESGAERCCVSVRESSRRRVRVGNNSGATPVFQIDRRQIVDGVG